MASGIYAIVDAVNGWYVYVGRAFDFEARFKQHHKEARAAAHEADKCGFFDYPITRNKNNCLAYLLTSQMDFGPVLLEELPPEEQIQKRKEIEWAGRLLEDGHPLSNGDASGTNLIGYGVDGRKNDCPYLIDVEVCNAALFPGRPYGIPSSKRVVAHPDGEITYALRKLRKDRPDLHERVLAEEISPHAAMVEAGFREKKLRERLEGK